MLTPPPPSPPPSPPPTAPPQVPKITDGDGNQLSGLVGPYNEGDELTLTCLTRGGKPRPSLIWWRDYAIIDDSFEYDDRDGTFLVRLRRRSRLIDWVIQFTNFDFFLSFFYTHIPSFKFESISLSVLLSPHQAKVSDIGTLPPTQHHRGPPTLEISFILIKRFDFYYYLLKLFVLKWCALLLFHNNNIEMMIMKK